MMLDIKAPYLRFGAQTSSQDLFKALALLTMIIDHIGLYFFPEEIIFRVIGRVSMPIWLFFVGFNYKPREDYKLSLLAIMITPVVYGLNHKILPLNILFSIMLARATIIYYSKNASIFEWLGLFLLSLLAFPVTNEIFEYGTFGVIVALWGYNYRHKIGNQMLQTILIGLAVIITQAKLFNISGYDLLILITLVSVTIYLLSKFTVKIYNFNAINQYMINISARYSLYLYCAHLLVILIIRNHLS